MVRKIPVAGASKGKKKSLRSLDSAYLEAIRGEVSQRSTISDRQQEDSGGSRQVTAIPQPPRQDESKSEPVQPVSPADPWLDIRVEVEPDGMEARLSLPSGYRFAIPLSEARILAGLQEKGIVHGIDHAAVTQAAAKSRASSGWPDGLIIAKGTPPAIQEITFPFLERLGKPDRLEGRSLEDFTFPAWNLEEAFATLDLRTLSRLNRKVLAVSAGEDLAIRKSGGEKPGRNIFGLEHSGRVAQPVTGQHVALDNTGSRWRAFIYGYFCCRKGVLSVIPPVWISPDRLNAYYIHLQQPSPARSPTTSDLEKILYLQGVDASFIDRERLGDLCGELRQGAKKPPAAIKIAQGSRPVSGESARVIFYFESGQKAGALRDNDTIDLRERDLVINAEKGQVLAEKVEATSGRPGMNLDGEPLTAPAGSDVALEAGEGVKVVQEKERLLYVAKQNGVILHNGKKITVSEMYHLKGDVDYNTGNLDVSGNLHLTGSVCAGFSVRAGGSVIIEGAVEAGAKIWVGEDLVVGNGIIGEATEVITLGNLRTMFIQDAQVIVRGDAWVGSYIFNGSVRVAGKLFVQRGVGTRGGRVVGGLVCAAAGIEVSTIGSPTNQNTLVTLQTDPELILQHDKLGQEIKLCHENITKILRTLNLESGDPESIRRLLAEVPPERRKQYLNLIKHLQKLLNHKRVRKQARLKLQEKIESGLKKARIKVGSELFQGNRIQIGDRVYQVEHDLGPSEFRLDAEGVLRG